MTRHWHVLEVRADAGAREILLGWLWEQDLTGIEEDPEDPRRLLAVFSREPSPRAGEEIAARLRAGGLDAGGARIVRCARIDEQDWAERWKRNWGPTPLGDTLLVVPTWIDPPPATSRATVRLDPGMAFGTGTHATTSLAWELLEHAIRDRPARTVLDVGAGSGILSLGLLARNAVERAVATELDPDAVRVLAGNAERNRARTLLPVLTDRVPVGAGRADLVVANLTAAEHGPVGEGIRRALAPHSRWVLSGLLLEQEEPVRRRWTEWGGRLEARRERDGWAALLWARE